MGETCFTILIRAEAETVSVQSNHLSDEIKQLIDKWLIQTNPWFRITKVEYSVPLANFLERFNEGGD